MMLASIADVHSNMHALRAAADIVRGRSPDMVVCAGDTVGYGAFPNECCAEVERLCDVVVAGNHDRAALCRDPSGMNPYAAAAAIWTADELDDRARRFLSSLGPSIRAERAGKVVAAFHGSPEDPDEYVHEDEADAGLLARARCDILVLGHTHIPYVKRLGGGLVLNPGSVGQPRDGDPRGSLAFVDTGSMACEFVRFGYDVHAAADAIVSAGLPRTLAQRLHIGR